MKNILIFGRAYSTPDYSEMRVKSLFSFLHKNLSTKETLRKYLEIIYYHRSQEERKESLNAEALIYCSSFCNWNKCV